MAAASKKRPAKLAAKPKSAAPKPKAKPAPKPKLKPAPGARNLDLEARLLANPDDLATRAVFADWLQSNGDPWGELIAYTDAGETAAAQRVMTTYEDHLTGGLSPDLFTWRNGFIEVVSLGVHRPAKTIQLLDKIFSLPASILTRDLYFPIAPDAEVAERLTVCAPRRLRKLFVWMSNGVSRIEIPSLHHLALYKYGRAPCNARGLRPVFEATHLPNVRHLELYNPLSSSIIRALIASPLLRQLEKLTMMQSCFDAAGSRLLFKNVDAFQHLSEFNARLPYEHQAAFDEAFAPQIAAWLKTNPGHG